MGGGVFQSQLGALADPSQLTGAIDISGRPEGELTEFLRTMLLIRTTEEAIGDLAASGEAVAPCHLGIGQEAIAAGICAQFRKSDRVFGTHRSHAQFLAMRGSVDALISEVLGKATGCSKGMGGSMHITDMANGFWGSVPIVGATIPISVGAGLAALKDGNGDVSACFFGDGATEEGSFHESLNLAAVYNVPVIFICENNLFSSHMDIALRQPSDRIARFADAHQIVSTSIDGNDVIATMSAARELIEGARNGSGPAFLEVVTYRWRGHVGPHEDIDVGIRRSPEELAAWKKRDPIRRLSDAMIAAGHIEALALTAIESEIKSHVDSAVTKAKAAPYPDQSALSDLVYSEERS